ncbi:MAG: hypothetical protein ABIC68_06730 [Candidatus Omnitrophota bacterium]
MKTKIFCILLLTLFVFPSLLFAKRASIEYPNKIIIKNIEYIASYETGNLFQKAYIEAKNIETDEIIWKKEIYQIPLNPIMEQDIQWVMITKIEMKDNKLLISNENEQNYLLDLETLEIEKQ